MHTLVPLELLSHRVDIWLCYPQTITASLLEKYELLLTNDEVLRKNCFRFHKHQQVYLVTRAMEKTLLSRYQGIPMNELKFERNTHGKPSLVQKTITSMLHYNISHTDDLIVMVVCKGRNIGVDVESTKRHVAHEAIIRTYFAKDEVHDIHQQTTAQEKNRRFYEYWTLKEAYVKAVGQGISTLLQDIQFDLTIANNIYYTEKHSGKYGLWQYNSFITVQTHIIALCVAVTTRAISDIKTRCIIPMASESVAPCKLMRKSGLSF